MHFLLIGQVLLLTSLASILASSSILNPDSLKYKYYSNKKGTQVIEIGPGQACQIFQGDDAAWLRETKQDRMTELNYIQFRLMVGKCQLEAFFNPQSPGQDKGPDLESPSSLIVNRIENQTAHTIISENDIDSDKTLVLNSTDGNTGTTESSKFPLIFPGTKWCGAGSAARSTEDLGLYVETDKCCRDHDTCPENMAPKECKNGLCNDSDYTRSHCDCDDRFRRCLQRDRSLSSLASFKIANLYFNILKPLCYAARPPVKWCRRHRITGECVEFEFDALFRSEWQFFPAQPYLTEAVEKLIQPPVPLPSLPFLQRPQVPEVPLHPPSPSFPDEDSDEEDNRDV
jgi:secretory phospholipase A2